ncbi:hypothetical protein T35B1_03993 [Salinisphaera shabanensis T35B1]|uniref:DUF971 domain-containing protein n=1 Tax=Salinisphaera shabanensis TaxID=180542 RepID=UPI00333F9291
MDAPTDITLHQKSKVLEVEYPDGANYKLPLEYLRVYSPSAEVRGHGGPMQLVTGKRDVGVTSIEPVGNYAIQLNFDDGHNTGIFSWETLRELGDQYEDNWNEYLGRLEKAEASRDKLWH